VSKRNAEIRMPKVEDRKSQASNGLEDFWNFAIDPMSIFGLRVSSIIPKQQIFLQIVMAISLFFDTFAHSQFGKAAR